MEEKVIWKRYKLLQKSHKNALEEQAKEIEEWIRNEHYKHNFTIGVMAWRRFHKKFIKQ